MDTYPSISVIIPTYNSGRFLDEALESVFNQTYPAELQVIVVDDGSTDETSSIAASFSDVEYMYQENSGVSAARNTGLEKAEGEFITFLDADDIWKPEKTQVQVQFMMDHPELGVIGTYAENFLEDGVNLPPWLENEANWSSLQDYIIPSTMMVQKSVFEKIDGFDTNLPSGEDTDLLWRMREAGIEFHILDEVLVRRRFHGENLSWKFKAEGKRRLLHIARQSVLRKSGKNKSG